MISFLEFLDVVIMTLAVGYIFADLFVPRMYCGMLDWRALWFSCIVTAPAVIVHELAHKFTALAAGLQATFHAAYFWLGLGVVLKLINSPIIFFVPAYVSINCTSEPCVITPLISAAVAFAGPALNLVLFGTAWLVLRNARIRNRRWLIFWHVTQRINLLLFILNMLPLPGFDGFKVYQGLWASFF
jgi:Zn-dependent protease